MTMGFRQFSGETSDSCSPQTAYMAPLHVLELEQGMARPVHHRCPEFLLDVEILSV